MSKETEVIVITGASAGIGRATVREFAKKGNIKFGLIARGLKGLEATKREVEALGCEALVLPVDVANPKQVEAAAERVERELGPISIWVNNAMSSILAPLKEVTVEEFHRVTEVTYLGQVHGAMCALRRMLPRDRGTIVFVGSALAYRGIPLQAAYCGAKHAIQGFYDSLRCELLHDKSNIHVTIVELPGVNTTQFEWIRNRMPNKPKPVGTTYQPEVAAQAIVWAAEHERRELELGLPTVESVIGQKLMPSVMDHYLADTVYEGHQTDEPDDPNRPDNLFQPVDSERDFGAHGPFDELSKRNSVQLWLNTHRDALAVTAAATLATIGLIGWSRSKR